MGSPLRIDVWSDIACPWCWLGKRHLEEALRRTGTVAEMECHAFELNPAQRGSVPVREYLAERYGSPEAIDAAHARLAAAGRAVGLDYDFDRALMANTFDAHRLHHFARGKGRGAELMERLMRARQAEGADVSDLATLHRLAMEVGLDPKEVDEVLAGEAFAADVRRDEEDARKLGIRGVPFFIIDGKLALSGAQPVEAFERALRQVAVRV